MELDIAILTGCDGRLQGQGDFSVDIGRLSRGQIRRRHRVHIGRVELGHHHTIRPGRVGDGQPEDAILETSACVDQVPRYFCRAWTISSPHRGGGRSSRLLRGLSPSGSL